MEEKINSCVFDTSVWIANFLLSDVRHEKARDAFASVGWRVYVPYAVLLETSTVLAYKSSKAQADMFLEFISRDERCAIVQSDYESEISMFRSVPAKISFADIAVICASMRLGAPLITFDKQMKKIYGRTPAHRS
ncbi:MAG: PIN domain-containing protein [bacterium]|nr:PIN domain-containing protein [bacterium]